jgi:prepilin-type N-terminal cleavage/methylation domain-containing protein
MKPTTLHEMRSQFVPSKHGFTLMETVIAILVLAVLLTGFLTVFTPAAQGIRRSISTQQADRLTATLERDMSNLKDNESVTFPTGFDKAFTWIKEGNLPDNAILVYQYRGDKNANRRADGTLTPMDKIQGKPGVNYITQSVSRRVNDPFLLQDITAIVGPIFYVKTTQLVYDAENNELILGTPGQIVNPDNNALADNPAAYTDAVITFSAAFYNIPSNSIQYLRGAAFTKKFDSAAKPVFVRNLAVRR